MRVVHRKTKVIINVPKSHYEHVLAHQGVYLPADNKDVAEAARASKAIESLEPASVPEENPAQE